MQSSDLGEWRQHTSTHKTGLSRRTLSVSTISAPVASILPSFQAIPLDAITCLRAEGSLQLVFRCCRCVDARARQRGGRPYVMMR